MLIKPLGDGGGAVAAPVLQMGRLWHRKVEICHVLVNDTRVDACIVLSQGQTHSVPPK